MPPDRGPHRISGGSLFSFDDPGVGAPWVADPASPARLGAVDILVNAARGNVASATLSEGRTFFDLGEAALREAIDLNLIGTLLPCQVFGETMAAGGASGGVNVNVSSMAAQRPLTRVVGYAAAKAAVDNLTRWLAIELAEANVRDERHRPGLFLGEQTRALLVREDGGLTERGRAVIDHTPAASESPRSSSGGSCGCARTKGAS